MVLRGELTARWLTERISGAQLGRSGLRMRRKNTLTGSTSEEARLMPVSTANEYELWKTEAEDHGRTHCDCIVQNAADR